MSKTASTGGRIIIVGGGLSGALCALHIAAARPNANLVIVERGGRLGTGLAYGACSPHHLLNVPVNRLDVGAPVSFETWIGSRPASSSVELKQALDESLGKLSDAFVPRRLFGEYVEEQTQSLIISGRLVWKRGEAVAFLDHPLRGVLLDDGRKIEGDKVIMALGNFPPKSPAPARSDLEDMRGYVADPWAAAALSPIDQDDPILLIGTGLTTVDVVLSLRAQGHQGHIIALSRRGLLPASHAFGGSWPAFLADVHHASPADLLRSVRREIAKSLDAQIPWQRVIDSIRPFIARIWQDWRPSQRKSFLRHLRPRWDVVRHRMAPRIASVIQAMLAGGALEIVAGRLAACEQARDGILIDVAQGKHRRSVLVRYVINCTGPRHDFGVLGLPLVVDARRKGLIRPDALALGIEMDNCAVISADGASSNWLLAVGAPTRPAWWEITAVPEINAQVRELAASLSETPLAASSLSDRFLDLGAGI